jgi:DNA-binding CsgD family transcriptional regulator
MLAHGTEIAETLNISVKIVENQMSKALRIAREAVLVFVVGTMF